MKVLMVVKGFGNIFNITKNISECLSKEGVDIYLMTTNDCSYNSHNVNVIRALKPIQGHMWYLKCKPFWAADRLYTSWFNARKRNTICMAMKPDIVHLQRKVPLVDQFYIPLLSAKFKTILTVHDVRYHRSNDINNTKSFLSRIYCNVHHLLVHTYANKRQLIEEFNINPERITIIPHGTDMPIEQKNKQNEFRKKLNLPQNIPVILFFGTIRANKGLDILLKAMRFIVKKYPDLKLVIAGHMPRTEVFDKYEKIINELKLSNNIVKSIKWIEDHEMQTYFQSSDIIVLPYKSFASQSGVLLQAYKYGKPVVVTDIGGLGETVTEDNTGIVVEPTPESIASGIIRLFDDVDFYENTSSNMQKAIKHKYNWYIVAKKTKEVYEKILAEY